MRIWSHWMPEPAASSGKPNLPKQRTDTGAPSLRYIKGRVIMGIAPGDHGLNGFLDAYDAETGERLWRWDSIPWPGEPGSETWAGDSWKTGGGDTG